MKVRIQKFKMRIQKNHKKNNDDDEPQEIVEKVEQPIDVENVEVSEHCNQQNSEEKKPLDEELLNEEPLDEEALKPEDKTQVEEVEQ